MMTKRSKPPRSKNAKRRALASLALIAPLAVSSNAAASSPTGPRSTIQQRVAAVRAHLLAEQDAAHAGFRAPDKTIAQWPNWPNGWANWPNWPNWRNF